jgi:quinoprotein glucose dehydrogenase
VSATAWGTLTAINIDTAEIVWQSTLGFRMHCAGVANTGRPGAAVRLHRKRPDLHRRDDDNRFRAFDSKTGRELWTYKLPASAHATPATYKRMDGSLSIVATGGSLAESPIEVDAVIAFALPRRN